MIVAEQPLVLEQQGMGRTVQAKIKASRKLFSFFSDGVYSDKPVAIVRELAANGIDSMVMSGQPTVPITITLPTMLDPTFTIKDTGLGMSEDFLFDKYLVYAEGSTKDSANEAIGGFGIGKAAVFSYTEQFSMVSTWEGVKGVYSVFVGDDGIPALSQISTSTTDEHNGVEISFPVEVKDIDLFHEAANKALKYFNPMPVVINGEVSPPDYSYVGNGWALRPEAGELGVILGGVRYPVQAQLLPHALRNDNRLGDLLGYGLDLTVPIGSISIALSREALSYNDITTAGITKALNGIIADVVATFGTMFDNQPTQWAAQTALFKETGGVSHYSHNARQKLLAANAKYKGVPLKRDLFVKDIKGAKAWLIEPVTTYGRSKAKSINTTNYRSLFDTVTLAPGAIGAVIYDDLPSSPKFKATRKIREYLDSLPRQTQTLVLRTSNGLAALDDVPDKKVIDSVIALLGSPEVVFSSTLPEPITVKTAKAANIRPKVRMFTWDGTGNRYSSDPVNNLTPGAGKTVKDIKYADQPDTGILVVMDNFDLPKGFHDKMKTGLIPFKDLYFVNKIDAGKLDKFKAFDEEFTKLLNAKLATLPANLGEMLALKDDLHLKQMFSEMLLFSKFGKLSGKLDKAQMATPFGQMVTLFEEYVRPLRDDMLSFRPFVKVELPDGLKTSDLWKQFKSQQGQLNLLIELLPTDAYRIRDFSKEHIALLVKNV